MERSARRQAERCCRKYQFVRLQSSVKQNSLSNRKRKNRNGQELVSPIRESARLPARGILETQSENTSVNNFYAMCSRRCADVSFIVRRYASGTPSKNSMKIARTDWNQAALYYHSWLLASLHFPSNQVSSCYRVIPFFRASAMRQTCKLTCSSGWPVNRRGSRFAR